MRRQPAARSIDPTTFSSPPIARRSLKVACVFACLLAACAPLVQPPASTPRGAAVRVRGPWPEFQGPGRAAQVPQAPRLLDRWSADGPPELWRRPLGAGFSQVATDGQRLYTLFADTATEFVVALDPADGGTLWRRALGPRYVDEWGDGPRATPLLAGGSLWALGTDGVLVCFDPATGEPVWSLDFGERFGAAAAPTMGRGGLPAADETDRFGHTATPLWVDLPLGHPLGEALLVAYTSSSLGPALVGLEPATGRVLWTALETAGPAFSSPALFAPTGDEELQIVQIIAGRVVGLSLDGVELWSLPWDWVTIAQPVALSDGALFVSTVNDWGSALVRPHRDSDGWRVEELWRQRRLRTAWSTAVPIGELICGFDNATFRCLGRADGALRWAQRGLGKGNFLRIGERRVLLLSDRGRLTLGHVDDAGLEERGSVEVFAGPSWTLPSFAEGRLYLRNHEELVALDLRALPEDAS
ncbi:MAG: PQQ-binding-like beta-propeller repeat protein [Acidobacteriota bacterium]